MLLKDRHYLITGASRGLGRALAYRCAAEGCSALTLWSRDIERMEELASSAEFENTDVFCQSVDVSDCSSLRNAFIEAEENGPFDGIINCAGYGKPCAFMQVTEEIFDRTMDTNFKGLYFLSQLMAGHMIENKRKGCIVNIGSVSGKTGDRMLSVYSPSKAAVIALTQSMAKELAPFGIRSNCVCPGAMETDMFIKDTVGTFAELYNASPEKLIQSTKNMIPLKRLLDPSEVADLICYLLSDKASGITGQSVNIDCGLEFH